MSSLEIKNLHVAIGEKEIVKGLSLEIERGKVHAIMGPNGSGKSTLAKVIAGHPDYTVTGGKILMDGENILEKEPDERARDGTNHLRSETYTTPPRAADQDSHHR